VQVVEPVQLPLEQYWPTLQSPWVRQLVPALQTPPLHTLPAPHCASLVQRVPGTQTAVESQMLPAEQSPSVEQRVPGSQVPESQWLPEPHSRSRLQAGRVPSPM